MTKVAVLGIDIAKNVFQLHGVNTDGQRVLKRRAMRDQLLDVTGAMPPCLIGIEACTGAFYWQRRFESQRHTVKIIAPKYVKPFVKGQKMTVMTHRPSALPSSNRTCGLSRRTHLSSRTFRGYIAPGSGW